MASGGFRLFMALVAVSSLCPSLENADGDEGEEEEEESGGGEEEEI